MSKDAFYFPHDSNAKDDPKCVLLIEQLGMEGYGIYWMLIETLRDQPGYKYPITLLPALARRYNTTFEKIKTVIGNYGLFIIEGDTLFFSQSLINRMIPLERRREQARIAGLKSAEKRQLGNGGSMDVQRAFNYNSKKEENIDNSFSRRKATAFTPPTLSELSEYISANNYSVDANQFIDYYTANGWLVGKNKMKDWKATVRNWHRRNNTAPQQSSPIKLSL